MTQNKEYGHRKEEGKIDYEENMFLALLGSFILVSQSDIRGLTALGVPGVFILVFMALDYVKDWRR